MCTQKKLTTLCIATVFTLGLAACGGGGGGDAPVTGMMDDTTMDESPMIAGQTIPSGTEITLPADVELQDGTLRAAMDETITVEGIGTFTCVSADGCSVDLTDGVITTSGDITVVSLDVTDATILAQLAAVLPPEPVELNELEAAQADAAAAAADAMTAAGNADTDATEAETAREDAATLQTGEKSEGLAQKAREQADAAQDAYADAKAASEAAAEADNVTDAVRAQVDAENARDVAQAAETKAGEYGQDSMDAAGGELMIVDTVKRVGDTTTIDAGAPASKVTAGVGDDEQTTRTGLLDEGMQPMATGEGSDAVAGTSAAPDDDPAVAYVAPVAAAADRMFAIGKLVDSADDTARLMIVTQYAGTKTVRVYAEDSATNLTGPGDGTIQTEGAGNADTDDDVFANLKSAGSYYLAGTSDGLSAVEDEVTDMAVAADVYSYPTEGADNTLGTADDGKNYVIVESTLMAGETTTVTYQHVDIHVDTLDRDGDGTMDNVEVTAKIPEATDYEHIHFGVWAALGEAEADGDQDVADLGIGFLQNYSDEGLTGADMPNNGSASYEGNWVATVRVADQDGNGDISLERGAASLEADFEEASIEATLTGLATLEGDIAGNTFSGDEASDITHTSLDADGEFTGEFSGGFYGDKAAEAGGVFAFTSEDEEAGEFSGAFGADRKLD